MKDLKVYLEMKLFSLNIRVCLKNVNINTIASIPTKFDSDTCFMRHFRPECSPEFTFQKNTHLLFVY